MSERERINEMVEAGKLNRAEANAILEALADLETAEQTLDATQDELNSSLRADNEPVTEQKPYGSKTSAREARQPDELVWLRLDFMAGDIKVSADAELSEPVIDEGKVRLERDGENFVVRPVTKSRAAGSGLLEDMGGWLSNLASRVGDVSVRVPSEYGVRINSKAGDIEVLGVAFLKAELMAGDIDIRDVGGLELNATAGDIDIAFAPRRGKHRVKVAAGEVAVELLGDSSVSVNASVGMGELDVLRQDGGDIVRHQSLTGGDAQFVIGGGEAELEISLSAGELDISVPRAGQ